MGSLFVCPFSFCCWKNEIRSATFRAGCVTSVFLPGVCGAVMALGNREEWHGISATNITVLPAVWIFVFLVFVLNIFSIQLSVWALSLCSCVLKALLIFFSFFKCADRQMLSVCLNYLWRLLWGGHHWVDPWLLLLSSLSKFFFFWLHSYFSPCFFFTYFYIPNLYTVLKQRVFKLWSCFFSLLNSQYKQSSHYIDL